MVGNFWVVTYMINPGHYVYEGLVSSVFWNNTRNVSVLSASQYFDQLITDGVCHESEDGSYCEVPANEFVKAFFGGYYGRKQIPRNVIILACILVVVRVLTFVALKNLTYSGK